MPLIKSATMLHNWDILYTVIPYVFICFIFLQIFVNSCAHSRCRPEVQWNKNSDGLSASTTWMAMGLLQSKKCSVSSTHCTKQWAIIREKPKASRTGTNLHPRNVLLKYFTVLTQTKTAFCRCRNLSRELWKTKHWLSFLSKGQRRHEAYCWRNWPITRVYTLSQGELVSFFLLQIKFRCIFEFRRTWDKSMFILWSTDSSVQRSIVLQETLSPIGTGVYIWFYSLSRRTRPGSSCSKAG